MRVKYGVAIAGSHGKTTTTSLVATVLRAAGPRSHRRRRRQDGSARLERAARRRRPARRRGRRERRLVPRAHPDDRGRHQHRRRAPRSLRHARAACKDAFVEFASARPVLRARRALPRPPARRSDLLPRIPRRHVTYGVSPQSDYSARGIQFRGLETSFNAYRRGEPLGGFTVKMPGAHNVLNCLATIAVADELEVPLDVTKQALADVRRRRAPLHRRRPGRRRHADRRLRPPPGRDPRHPRRRAPRVPRRRSPRRRARSSRTATPARATSSTSSPRAFNEADVLLVTDIYAAGERADPGRHRRAPRPVDPGARPPRRALHRRQGRPPGGPRKPSSGPATWSSRSARAT